MATKDGATAGFSAEERAAMKQRAAELRAEAKASSAAEKAAADEAALLAKIAEMPDGDRELAERVHAIVTAIAPELAPKLIYGQPGYARDGKIVVFFRSGQMDKQRYSTLGLSALAAMDEPDGLWPTSYALIEPTEQAWQHVTEIVRRATAAPDR